MPLIGAPIWVLLCFEIIIRDLELAKCVCVCVCAHVARCVCVLLHPPEVELQREDCSGCITSLFLPLMQAWTYRTCEMNV